LNRALKSRDGGCCYPGCDRRRHTQSHHLHEGGYGVRRTDDGLCVFTRPDGTRVERNGAQRFSGNVVSLQTHLRTLEPELAITADTAKCQWRGETMDYSQAIEAMQFLEHKAASPETLGNAT
jgi:hypothetical protein